MMNFDSAHLDNITTTQWIAPPPPAAAEDLGMGVALDEVDTRAGAFSKKKSKKPKVVECGLKSSLLNCQNILSLAPTFHSYILYRPCHDPAYRPC